MVRKDSVTLEANGVIKVFSISHAERLLGMRNNGGWKLAENSKYKYDQQDGLTIRRNKGKNKGAEQVSNDKQGSETRKKVEVPHGTIPISE